MLRSWIWIALLCLVPLICGTVIAASHLAAQTDNPTAPQPAACKG